MIRATVQRVWTLDTLKKIPGQVRATGADLVFRQDEQDLQDFWRRSRPLHPVNLVHLVQKSSLVSTLGAPALCPKSKKGILSGDCSAEAQRFFPLNRQVDGFGRAAAGCRSWRPAVERTVLCEMTKVAAAGRGVSYRRTPFGAARAAALLRCAEWGSAGRHHRSTGGVPRQRYESHCENA